MLINIFFVTDLRVLEAEFKTRDWVFSVMIFKKYPANFQTCFPMTTSPEKAERFQGCGAKGREQTWFLKPCKPFSRTS